ncbi:ATP-binding protein [Marinobacter sp. C2H3]|uniref:ATP-binding protein n=1 Tax=Marinobacter sp. C2H3 TaxID=3119003 RepID=UPI00300F55E3
MTEPSVRQAPLSRKLLLLGALPSVVMFIVLMGFFTSARLDDARQNLLDSGQMQADNLAPALEYPVVAGNRAALEKILNQSLKHSNADWVRVTDVLGHEIGRVSAPGITPGIPDDRYLTFRAEILQQPLELGAGQPNEWFELEYGFESGALRVGTVEVGVDPATLETKRQDVLWTSVTVGLALLAFTMILIRHFLGGVLAPVYGLSERIRQLMQRNYQLAPVHQRGSSREIIEIETNLNSLSEQLAELRDGRDRVLSASETARQRAEQASQAKSEFLATMSHELRTPLSGVLGMVDLIQEEPLSQRQRDYLVTARQSTEDLLTVITDILDYARMDSGNLELEHREFDLRTVISNCTASYRHMAEQHGLLLNISFFGDWPEPTLVIGDSGRLRRVLAGLLDNAIKFTGDGYINIQASCLPLDDNCVTLTCSVNDSGKGIPTERLPDIFNSFEQLESGDSRGYGGTGMGLALVQRLVELMGGHIQVETDLGRGSSFRFELPFELAPVGPAEHSAWPAEARLADNETARALVVEDNPVNQRVASALLTRLGFRTETAENGQQAVDMVRRNHNGYDVILMDCQMPVMSGYEATRHIREWEQRNGQAGIPIIALTADVLPGTEATCLENGMNGYLAKPVRKERLRELLSRWIHL